ncbi:MAG: CHRD domain-containing protein, partial [Betaproteobacteria bacterium]|nr:CHRD domain-containing protein [Betaproteobacteria bacterium]
QRSSLITIIGPDGMPKRTQTWHYPGPPQCLECHNNANPTSDFGTGMVLGLKTRHMNGSFTYPSTGRTSNQLRTWQHLGMFANALPEQDDYPELDRAVPLDDATATLEHKVRSYVDNNCGFCHQPGGPGPIWDARYSTPLAQQNIAGDATLNPFAVLRRFDVDNSRMYIRDAVDPRVSMFPTPMPPLARNIPHTNWLNVVSAWVNYPFDTTSAVAVGDPTKIKLKFDRALEPVSAQTAANYGVTNGIMVTAATLNPMDASEVILTVSAMTPNANYRVTVSNVKESGSQSAGVLNPIWPNTWEAFTYLTAPISQTINFSALADKFKGDAPFTISAAGGSSTNPVVFTSTTPLVCSASGVNGSTIVLTGTPGLCTIAANQAGNATHDPATQVTRSFKVLWRVNVVLEGSQQSPPVVTQATGGGTATYDATTKLLALDLTLNGLESTETMAHIHGPAARGAGAGVLIDLNTGSPKVQSVTLDAAQEAHLLAGQLYINVHTVGNPGGEVRGQLDALGSAGVVLRVDAEGLGSDISRTSPTPSAICTAPCAGNPAVYPPGTPVVLSANSIYGEADPSLLAVWRGCDTQFFQIGAFGENAICSVTLNTSRTVTATYEREGTPSAPLILQGVAGNGQAIFTFNPPVSTRGGSINGYTVSCASGMTVTTTSGTSSPIVVPLINNTTYQCSVRATTATVNGATSNVVTVTPFVPPALTAVKSRKDHKSAGVFDLNVVLEWGIGGPITIEPRGGPHKLIFEFNVPVTSVGTITLADKDGVSTVRSGHKIVGNTIELPLDDMGDNLRVAIAITGINGSYTANAAVGFLQGDVNDSKRVTAADVIAIKRRSGSNMPVDAMNARFDINLDGVISSADISVVKNRSGRMIP